MPVPDPKPAAPAESTPPPLRLPEQLRERIRVKHYALRTERVYAESTRRYILFHSKRHQRHMGRRRSRRFSAT